MPLIPFIRRRTLSLLFQVFVFLADIMYILI
jgi:hypothetical protein